ncbi:hypothetical protein V2J59_19135 [Pseudomonas alliivorans]|uniref:DUF1449 family protein n=1 Tax=Pseudomonas alliivorans TaxID=2810613 RepID=A0ABS4C6U5_9PSED|nr:hypothetical protein [Pseudomonas alliivorans]MBP0946386.1 hypothetical protein [Pseudomonas alliivorans]MEE4327999.1 hypothetical protein [Pseudomonas alliivorans]MEE4335919.1 hypothetical protein [Pseudomonas alliivorans]MEE4369337.1 hypothetical protein [Pseudomonas alliivorans]MEE4732100.1 hypothetical protein [Pseudomonas alliivorans]
MYHFIETALSFPVVIFSLLLAITVFYWLMVCLGVLDGGSADIDMQAVSALDSASAESGKGLVARLGLSGVPASIILTLISLSGWLISYLGHLLLIDQLSLGFFYYPLGFVSGLLALVAASIFTLVTLRLFKPLVRKIRGPEPTPICGQVAVVTSQTVTGKSGRALMSDGGAGLLLQVRTFGTPEIKRNDRVVLLQYLADEHAYLVVSESEFKG